MKGKINSEKKCRKKRKGLEELYRYDGLLRWGDWWVEEIEGVVEWGIRVMFEEKNGLKILIKNVEKMRKVEEEKKIGILSRIIENNLKDRSLEERIILIEIRIIGLIIGWKSKRKIEGFLMKIEMNIGMREEIEELRDEFVMVVDEEGE